MAKSETITMPVMMKDEKKYADCVDVLDQLEDWTHQIYSAAGLCHESTHSSDPIPAPPMPASSDLISSSSPPAIQLRSRPDEPASHIPPTSSGEDPLHGVKIPCSGDQLTRVRLAGAKDLQLDNGWIICIPSA